MHLKQKHPHLRVVLSIGGAQASQVFPTVAASAVLRDNFARSARGLVEASGLDGIDSTDSYPARLRSERGSESALTRDRVKIAQLRGSTPRIRSKAPTSSLSSLLFDCTFRRSNISSPPRFPPRGLFWAPSTSGGLHAIWTC